eukprot:3555499-Pyramimonas_sp.AAC.1
MVVNAGMQKNRLHIKRCKFTTEMYETYFIRASNGHISPGMQCPASLCMRTTGLTIPGAPR